MKIVLATGGTGGHIYPAIALAKELEADHELVFIGSNNRMEKEVVQDHNFQFFGFNLGTAPNKLMKVKQMIQLFLATAKTYLYFKKEDFDLVIGFGSYITAPTLLTAKFLNVPIILHEQNSSIGRSNEIFYDSADYLISCYDSIQDDKNDDKIKLLGNPRASEVIKLKRDEELLPSLGLVKGRKTILIVMGSLGSKTINDIMFNSLKKLSSLDLQIIFVTGKKHFNVYDSHLDLDNVKIVPYIDQAQALLNTDLVIARGGATTAAEICALGVPSIIIPSPFVANNHQYINAMELAKVDASLVLKEDDLTENLLLDSIETILFDDEKLEAMGQAALTLAFPNASKDIISLIEEYSCD